MKQINLFSTNFCIASPSNQNRNNNIEKSIFWIYSLVILLVNILFGKLFLLSFNYLNLIKINYIYQTKSLYI